MNRPESTDTMNATGQRTRLLLVDDHPIVVEGLAQLLRHEADLDVQWIAANVAEALDICRNEVPDLSIVDISLGEDSGIELIRTMRTLCPDMPILVMSMHEESLYAPRALRAGARGYINKQMAPRHVVAAIRQVRDGEIYLSAASRNPQAGNSTDPATLSVLSRLSDRELEVLQLIGKGMRKAEIAKRLGRSVNTVETHRSGIKKKLRFRSASELARFAFLHFHKN